MNDELKNALEELETKLHGKNKTEVKSILTEFKNNLDSELEQKLQNLMTAQDVEQINEFKTAFEAEKLVNTELKNRLNELETKFSKIGGNFANGEEMSDFAVEFKNVLREGFQEIKSVSKGRSANFEMNDVEIKTVGVMTASTNLTGTVVKTYQSGVARVPSQMVNMADLIPSVQSATGTYVVYRETGSEGGITFQTTAGTAKSQIDYDFTEVVFNANYLAGYVRIAKQMIQDLPFMSSFLPEALRRDYFKAENSAFYTALKSGATASTSTATEGIERIIHDIGQLENANYMVNGVVLNPIDWATIAVTKPSDFSLPQVVAYVNGQLVINGIPVFKASWVPQDEYIVGDWSMAKKVIADGLAVEFFEQDQDNVIKNLITVRVESRVVLGIDRPDAFILGSITNPT